MIITRTPFRISFVGGGSDLKNYYEKYCGSVLSTAINKYMYLSLHPYFFKQGYLLKYSQTEQVDKVEDIKHNILREVFKLYNIKGVDFASNADIPAGTGLGSSSAFTAGLINLCNAYTEKYMTKEEIAKLSCEIEIDYLKEPIGKQDQYACACGGLNFIEFLADGSVNVEKVFLPAEKYEKLQNNLLLFYTGETRSAGKILQQQSESIKNDSKKINNLHKMVDLSKILKKELLNGNVDSMGEILDTGWKYKKELSDAISNNTINEYYETAIKNGATGGKLLGAGGGGFLLFYSKEKNHGKLREALSPLKEVDFRFENNGTNLIYYAK